MLSPHTRRVWPATKLLSALRVLSRNGLWFSWVRSENIRMKLGQGLLSSVYLSPWLVDSKVHDGHCLALMDGLLASGVTFCSDVGRFWGIRLLMNSCEMWVWNPLYTPMRTNAWEIRTRMQTSYCILQIQMLIYRLRGLKCSMRSLLFSFSY